MVLYSVQVPSNSSSSQSKLYRVFEVSAIKLLYSLSKAGMPLYSMSSPCPYRSWYRRGLALSQAGDTTSKVIAALFFYLSRCPNDYKRLSREIRFPFQTGSDIRNGPQLQACVYLRACITEASHMTPPVAGTLWREPYENEYRDLPFVVYGHVIPPGTQVGVNIYVIHNEEYFPMPLLFNPDRWLEFDTETWRRMNLAFCPFAVGPRSCAGKSSESFLLHPLLHQLLSKKY